MKLFKLLLIASVVATTGCAYFGMGSRPLSELTEKYTDETSKFVAVDGVVMHYQDEGQGPVVLMLHGEHSSLHIWDAWAKRLAGDFRVVRLDLPGHGLTGPDPATETYDLEYMMGKVEAFMDKLSLDSVQMVGASYGGFITWNFAMENPERVERMVLVDSTGFDQKLHPVLGYNTIPVLAGFNSWTLPRGQVEDRLETMYYDEEKITDQIVRRNQELMLRKGNRSAFIDVARTMEDQLEDGNNQSDRIKYIQTPTLVMWGEQDEWTTDRVMRQFKVNLPNMTFVSYEAVGHLPMEELPRQSARDAYNYLASGELGALPDNEEQGWIIPGNPRKGW
ncbi:alpha/beta hydrolase [uncultured Thalassolituus sp.]|uniref:alpha/beta fold hydrolase n=1 Tax=uncultured Thalassolituus sp. TaxID=285273 RepID=UPI002634DBFD|nr:alpha/beta hydrolase [uncultured Thalassolituus sp.]